MRCRGKMEECSVSPSLTSKPEPTWGGISCLEWLLLVAPSLWTSFNQSSQTILTGEGSFHSSQTTHSAKRWQRNWDGVRGGEEQKIRESLIPSTGNLVMETLDNLSMGLNSLSFMLLEKTDLAEMNSVFVQNQAAKDNVKKKRAFSNLGHV